MKKDFHKRFDKEPKRSEWLFEATHRMAPRDKTGKRPMIQQGRRRGNTTRIVDEAIQQLFERGMVCVIDHAGMDQPSTRAFNILRDRMEREHPGVPIKYWTRNSRNYCAIDNFMTWKKSFLGY